MSDVTVKDQYEQKRKELKAINEKFEKLPILQKFKKFPATMMEYIEKRKEVKKLKKDM